MNLRRRLFAAMGVLLVLILVGGYIVVRSQRSFLTGQVDDQLAEQIPFMSPFPPLYQGAVTQFAPAQFAQDLPEMSTYPGPPVSNLFVGLVTEEGLIPFQQGPPGSDTPEVPAEPDTLDLALEQAVTIDSSQGRVRFRIRTVWHPEINGFLIVALPLEKVDRATRQLLLVVVIVGVLVLAVMAAAVWWVERLGVKPIRNVTRVAEAISAGDRSQRVAQTDSRTEAGKLAHAFNLMLDDRDTIEARRRQFVADASHELRTPLTSIQGYIDLYSHGRFADPALVDDMMRRMGREALRMKDLVEDLLLLANLDQQRPLRADTVNLSRLVTDVANDARVVQPERSILVEIQDTAMEVTGDELRLQQVIAALVDNAMTHTDIGCEIRLKALATPNGTEIVVEDDGPGLDSARADRVFDRFFRYDQSRSRATGGSGLGLAIARSIVEAHAGTIHLHTTPGAGCKFTILLPAQMPPTQLLTDGSEQGDSQRRFRGDR